MKKGFTLAEVLITLAVIGIVAALTIPVVVHNYQKKALYTQFMKTYNCIATAMSLATADHGDISGWNWGGKRWNPNTETYDEIAGDNPFGNYILPNLKYNKVCENFEDCFADSYSLLNGDTSMEPDAENPEEYTLASELSQYATNPVVLADGATIAVSGSSSDIMFVIDTNGKKGPNVLGRDFFMMYYRAEYDGEPEGFEFDEDADFDTSCNPNSNDTSSAAGYGCAQRLIQEGKMNY